MANRKDMERIFSENVDRILAGQRPDVDGQMDEEFQGALEFASRMVDMEPVLRPGFQRELEARWRTSLVQLEEKARARQRESWFERLLHRPAWQAAAAVIVLAIAGLIVWVSGMFQSPGVPPEIIGATADTTKTNYATGEIVGIEVVLKNVSDEPFTIQKYPPILSVMDSETGLPVYTSGAGQNTVILESGDSTSFTIQWDQRDARGDPVGVGRYYIELEDIDNQGEPLELNLTKPVYFQID